MTVFGVVGVLIFVLVVCVGVVLALIGRAISEIEALTIDRERL